MTVVQFVANQYEAWKTAHKEVVLVGKLHATLVQPNELKRTSFERRYRRDLRYAAQQA
jgi:hypothetical protein